MNGCRFRRSGLPCASSTKRYASSEGPARFFPSRALPQAPLEGRKAIDAPKQLSVENDRRHTKHTHLLGGGRARFQFALDLMGTGLPQPNLRIAAGLRDAVRQYALGADVAAIAPCRAEERTMQ